MTIAPGPFDVVVELDVVLEVDVEVVLVVVTSVTEIGQFLS